ncbi:MAG: AraC family transcriptional regulator, partial [Clostridiales bacterium]|nr:AraC family transcriptional regulator [Clostridiales bacterium]
MENIGTEDLKKRGYLNEDFLFFKLRDQKKNEFEFHYHDFNKIIIFLSG